MELTRVAAADVQITGVLDMRENRITGLTEDLNIYPTSPKDGATKAYVDATKVQLQASLPTEVNNGTF